MRDFKDEQIIFYCNCVGELHEGGKVDLKSAEELPLPLQSVYETFWTDCLSTPCYIAYVDGRPGLLLAAEYNDIWCDEQGIPNEYDQKYRVLRDRGARLEKLVQAVTKEAEVGIGVDTGFDMELILFIPTQTVSGSDILRLYYLMDEFAYIVPPAKVAWGDCNCKLAELASHCIAESEASREIYTQLNAAAEGPTVPYMGLALPRAGLPRMADVIARLEERVATDWTLNHYRKVFKARFGHPLIWKYPFSGDMFTGGTLIPVWEGFLYLPYTETKKESGARYDLKAAKLLSAGDAAELREKCLSYSNSLCGVLDDIERYLDVPTIRYADVQGNHYFVRSGIGGVYKAFRRYAEPKNGQRHETVLHTVPYRDSRDQAQRDLDQYAEEHNLQPIERIQEEGDAQ